MFAGICCFKDFGLCFSGFFGFKSFCGFDGFQGAWERRNGDFRSGGLPLVLGHSRNGGRRSGHDRTGKNIAVSAIFGFTSS